MITRETRYEAHQRVDKTLRYIQIKEILEELKQATAKEIAVEMYKKGYTPSSERNFSAPRLTELVGMDMVRVIDKKQCDYTGKKVAIYTLTEYIKERRRNDVNN